MMARRMKRSLSLLLALVMCLSLVNISAFATGSSQDSEQQIVSAGGTVYYDVNGQQHTTGTLGEEDIVVEMSKTVAKTDTENEFEITLQVKTTQKLTEIPASTPDAAVVLVLDVSNSMDDCVNCGKEQNDKSHQGESTTRYYCYGTSGSTYERGFGTSRCRNCGRRLSAHNAVTTTTSGSCAYRSRLEDAQAAALNFLDQFANDTGATGDDRRMVSIVSFGSNAKRELNWVDVRTQEGMDAAIAAVNGVQVAHGNSQNGGTNIEGGLMLAKNILNAGRQNENQIKDVNYLYTILLTDGNPTYHVEHSSHSTDQIKGTSGGYTETNKSDAQDVGKEAGAIRGITNLSKLYSICFGTVTENRKKVPVWDTTPFENWSDANPRTTYEMTVGEWLAAFSTAAYNGQATGLFDSFDSIADQIATAAQAWRVTDTMGTNIVYDGIVSVSNKAGNGTIYNDVTVADDNKSFVWNILGSEYDDNITDIRTDKDGQMISGTLGYTFKYRIQLDNTAAVTDETVYATNTSAILKYMVADEDGNWPTDPDDLKEGTFMVPQVKGYVDSLTFKKVAYHNDQILGEGAVFTLAHDPSCPCGITGVAARTATATADGEVSFTGVPSGHTYTLTETTAPQDYVKETKSYTVTVAWGELEVTNADTGDDAIFDGTTFRNKIDPQEKTITITKTWAGDPGSSVSVDIYRQNGARDDSANKPAGDPADTVADAVTMTGSGDTWTATSKTLPTVDQETGDPITYYVKETDIPDGYEVTYGGNQNDGFTVTNTQMETGTVTVNKVWNAPASYYEDLTVVVDVLKNGTVWQSNVTLSSSNNWTATFENAPTHIGGQAVTYTVVEESVGGVAVDEQSGTVTVNDHIYTVSYDGTTVTNTLNTANETVTFTGTKTWKDNNDAYDTRPENITIQVKNGDEVVDKQEISASNNWSYSITVPKFDAQYNEISYTVEEVVNDSDYTGTKTDDGFTNTLTGTTSVSVTKVWDVPYGFFGTEQVMMDEGSDAVYDLDSGELVSEAVEPTYDEVEKAYPEVTIQLYQNETKLDGYTRTLNESNNWTDTFENLPKYDENGVAYRYTVKETIDGADYDNGAITLGGQPMTVSIDGNQEEGFTVTNSAQGETSVTVNKVWVDGSNVSSTRPETIYVALYADGTQVGDVVALTSANVSATDSNNWTHTWANLPAYNGADAITYTVAETDASGTPITTLGAATSNDSYTVVVNGFTITNTLNQREDVSLTLTKNWNDGDNKWNTRPDSVTFGLYADGVKVQDITLTAPADGNTTWTTTQVSGLARYNAETGAPIVYTVEEVTNSDGKLAGANGATYTPGNITCTPGADGVDYVFTCTNTLDIPTIDLPASKTWIDGNRSHNGESVTVALVVNGEVTETTLTLDQTNAWGKMQEQYPAAFEDLPLYSPDYQTKYEYSVKELNVPDGYTDSYQGGAVINTLDDPMDVQLTITKTWVGPESERPSSITVGIFRYSNYGETQYVTDITLSAPAEGENQNVWTGTTDLLDRYDAQGYPYTYLIKEQDGGTNLWVENGGTVTFGNLTYDVTISGFNITNTVRQVNDVTVSGTKTWEGVPEDVELPDSIQVLLWADGGWVAMEGVENPVTVTPDENGNWTYEWTNLPRYAVGYNGDGHEIVYTVTEYGADANGDIVYGNDHYKVAGGAENENGTYDLVNTYQSTDKYYYKVEANYITHYTNGDADTQSGYVTVVEQTESLTAGDVTVRADEHDNYEGNAYTYVSGSALLDGAGYGDGNETAFRIEMKQANHVYTLQLTYERTVDNDDPYIPPTPTPDPDPTDPVDPPTDPTDPPTEIEDEDPPLSDLPDDEGEIDISDEEPPLSDLPEETIDDEEPPMADAPETGDNLWLWITTASLSGLGLIALGVNQITTGRKKKDAESK